MKYILVAFLFWGTIIAQAQNAVGVFENHADIGKVLHKGNLHRKTGWMARTNLDTSAAMICLTVHGDGLTAFQYRKKNGTNIEEVKTPILAPDILQLERRGRSYFVSVAKIGNPMWTVEIPDFDFPEELLVGVFICSHNKNVTEEAQLTHTRIYSAVK